MSHYKKAGRSRNTEIAISPTKMTKFKYLEKTATNQISIHEEIKRRLN
jgi:hypothetical protein